MSLSNFFISVANATEAGSDVVSTQGGFASIAPLLMIFVVFYFFIIRPQNKKFKDQQDMTKKTQIGDDVVVLSGVFGKISKVNEDDTVFVEIAKDVEIKIYRNAIAKNNSLEARIKSEAVGKISKKK